MRYLIAWPLFVVGLIAFLLVMASLPGCETVGAGLDALPATPEQLDAGAEVVGRVGGFLPSPFDLIVAGIGVALATVAEAKRRREKREKQTLRDGAVQIVGSVKAFLDKLPPQEQATIKAELAVGQDAKAQALVSEAKAQLKAASLAG